MAIMINDEKRLQNGTKCYGDQWGKSIGKSWEVFYGKHPIEMRFVLVTMVINGD